MRLEGKTLFIRADATPHIGAGHVMRCLALGQAWQRLGGQVRFLSHCQSDALRHRIHEEGFDLIPVKRPHPHRDDLEQTLGNIARGKAPDRAGAASAWVVVDGYHFDGGYQKTIRDEGARLLVADDMGHLPHYHAHIVLNQNINAQEHTYSCDPDTLILSGTRYVLLREDFLAWNHWRREIPANATRILITLGGSDPCKMTLRVIEALRRLDGHDLQIKVVIGPENPHAEILKAALISCGPRFRAMTHVQDMAVSASGSTCWELAFMGLPALAVVLSENQEGIASGLQVHGVCLNLGWPDGITEEGLIEAVRGLMHDKERRQVMSQLGRSLVDGLGAFRVASALAEVAA